MKRSIINIFAIVGVVNTVLYIKDKIEEFYETQSEKTDITKKLEDLNDKIKYVENVSLRIDHVQYTLSELKNILSKQTYDEGLYELKSANSEFTNELLN